MMLRRKLFGLALFAPLAAKGQTPASSDNVLASVHAWNDRKPKNNECPVCGTMAPPITTGLCRPVVGEDHFLKQPNPPCEAAGPTRCARCNAAFWQDAEGK